MESWKAKGVRCYEYERIEQAVPQDRTSLRNHDACSNDEDLFDVPFPVLNTHLQ